MSDSYITLFLNSALSSGNLTGPLSLLILFFGRFLPIIALTPFFGAKILPQPVKMAFAIAMFVVFLPKLLIVTTTPITFNYLLILYLIKELFVGTVLGFIIGLPFMIVQNAGIIIDHQRGGASLMVNDPTIQNQSSPLGTLFNFIMICIFYTLDGPFLFIDTLITSYEVVPPDQFFNQNFFATDSPFWRVQVMDLFNQMMVITIRLASPALIAILMTDVFLGIANRLAPQVQITFLGMPLKSLLALAIVFFGWQLFTDELGHEIYYWLGYLTNVLKVFKASMGS